MRMKPFSLQTKADSGFGIIARLTSDRDRLSSIAKMKAPPVIPQRKPLKTLLLAAAGLLILSAVFYFFNPEQYGFYPRCPLHELTGLQCPGCGGLRASHQLLHGHIQAAFRLNPLMVLLSPLAFWLALRWVAFQITGRQWPAPFLTVVNGGWFLGVLVVYGVARNIPWVQAKLDGLL
jgi:hypothetical protein